MIIVGGLSRLVQNVESIQGMSQFVSGCYFSQKALNVGAKVFPLLSWVANYIPSYEIKHEITVISCISFLHRICLLFSEEQVDRPKSEQDYLGLIESMGVELFFLVKSNLLASFVSRISQNMIGDLCIGIPYLLNGMWNWRGDKTVRERKLNSIITARNAVILLEARIEYSRDLQKIQQNLRDFEAIYLFCAELEERKEMLLEREFTVINEEIKELEWLKGVVKKIVKSQPISEGSALIDNLRLNAINAAKELNQDSRWKQNLSVLKTLIDKTKRTLKTKEKKHLRENNENSKKELKACRIELKLLQFVADAVADSKTSGNSPALNEELSNLKKWKVNSDKIGRPAMINSLILYIRKTFISEKRTQVNEHLTSLKREQQQNAMAMLEKPDMANEQIDEELRSEFNDAFDAHLLENIAVKLVNCDQYLQSLEGATELGGDLYNAFDGQIVDDSANSAGKSASNTSESWMTNHLWAKDSKVEVGNEKENVEAKEFSLSKKIKKRDLYAAIISEIESLDKMLDELEEKIAARHKESYQTYLDFKDLVKVYSIAVRNLFHRENIEERDEGEFKSIKLPKEEMQRSLLTVKRAFQEERDKLLEKLRKAEEGLEKSNELGSLRERYFGPYTKLLFGLSILWVRFVLKADNAIAPGSYKDLCLDTVFMSFLALSRIGPLLLTQYKSLRSQRVIVIRERDARCESVLDIFKGKIASLIDSLQSFMPSWPSRT